MFFLALTFHIYLYFWMGGSLNFIKQFWFWCCATVDVMTSWLFHSFCVSSEAVELRTQLGRPGLAAQRLATNPNHNQTAERRRRCSAFLLPRHWAWRDPNPPTLTPAIQHRSKPNGPADKDPFSCTRRAHVGHRQHAAVWTVFRRGRMASTEKVEEAEKKQSNRSNCAVKRNPICVLDQNPRKKGIQWVTDEIWHKLIIISKSENLKAV